MSFKYTAEIVMICSAYLLGSIPFGLLIAKAKGIDIRKQGSGNIGATNVFRCVGKGWGILTFFLDMLKGLLSAFVLPSLIPGLASEAVLGWRLAGGACAIVGHNWPCWLRFKGGKGIATSLGVLLGAAPAGAGIAAVAWVIVFLALRYVSLASIAAALALIAYAWIYYAEDPVWFKGVLTLLALLAILKHHANIRRLLNGTENRFSFGKKKS